jgi:hypothetical protein
LKPVGRRCMKLSRYLPNRRQHAAHTKAKIAAYALREKEQRVAEDRLDEERIANMTNLSPTDQVIALKMLHCNAINRDIFDEHEKWKDEKAAVLYAACARHVQAARRPRAHQARVGRRSGRSQARKAAAGDSGDSDGPARRVIHPTTSFYSPIRLIKHTVSQSGSCV